MSNFQPTTLFDGTVTVEDLVQHSIANHPAIAEAQHRIDGMRHRIPQVTALPDPTVSTTTYLEPVQTASGEQTFAIGVNQKIINSERRTQRAAVVFEEIRAVEASLEDLRNEIAEKVRIACYQLQFIRKAIEITKEDIESLDQIISVVERQYEVKKSVSQQDVLNIHIERSKVENELTELKKNESTYMARLARLLRIDPRSTIEFNNLSNFSQPNLDLDDLIAVASAQRPDLRAQLATIRRDCRKVKLAQLNHKPDFNVGLNWIATSSSGISPVANGDDALLLGVGFNLPIYKNRIRAEVCEAQANRRASCSHLEMLQDQVVEEIFDLVAKLESNREVLSLIQEDILPKAERTLALSIDQYATDSIEYVQLIANWRAVLRYRINEANLQFQHLQLLASLARIVGQLDPLSDGSNNWFDSHDSEIEPPTDIQPSG